MGVGAEVRSFDSGSRGALYGRDSRHDMEAGFVSMFSYIYKRPQDKHELEGIYRARAHWIYRILKIRDKV